MSIDWQNTGDFIVVDARIGGAGNPWQILDRNGMLDAPSGGGRARETQWGRAAKKGIEPRGFIYTGNPEDWTATVTYPVTVGNFQSRVGKCPFDLRARPYCENLDDMSDLGKPGAYAYHQATATSYGFDNPLAQMDGQGAESKRTIAVTAVLEERYSTLAHDDISGTTADVAINKIINTSVYKCQDNCGLATSEEDGFWFVTDQDSSPLYVGNPAPWFYYTSDGGATWASVRIDTYTATDALDVVQCGQRVVAFSTGKAPTYARFEDIVNGVVAPNLWNTSSGFSSVSSPNFPKAAVAINSSLIYAVANGGGIWKSTDGGLSFTAVTSGTTTNLNCITEAGEQTLYIGGNSGLFLRIIGGTVSTVTVEDSTGADLTSNINTIHTPADRANEVYLGTAGGEIWRSKTASNTRPTWENMAFDRKGTGSIKDIKSVGYRGDILCVVQSDANGNSRVLWDYSGGALGDSVRFIGDFNTPANFGINSIAPANVNFALTVGEIHLTYGFVGKIRAAIA